MEHQRRRRRKEGGKEFAEEHEMMDEGCRKAREKERRRRRRQQRRRERTSEEVKERNQRDTKDGERREMTRNAYTYTCMYRGGEREREIQALGREGRSGSSCCRDPRLRKASVRVQVYMHKRREKGIHESTCTHRATGQQLTGRVRGSNKRCLHCRRLFFFSFSSSCA